MKVPNVHEEISDIWYVNDCELCYCTEICIGSPVGTSKKLQRHRRRQHQRAALFYQTRPLPLNLNHAKLWTKITTEITLIYKVDLLKYSPLVIIKVCQDNQVKEDYFKEDDHVRSPGPLLQLRIYRGRRLEPDQGKEDHRRLGKNLQQNERD